MVKTESCIYFDFPKNMICVRIFEKIDWVASETGRNDGNVMTNTFMYDHTSTTRMTMRVASMDKMTLNLESS